jgi:hypothetical protein
MARLQRWASFTKSVALYLSLKTVVITAVLQDLTVLYLSTVGLLYLFVLCVLLKEVLRFILVIT